MFKKFSQRDSDSVYFKIIITMVALIVVIILVLSWALYLNFQNIVLFQIFNSEKNSLSQISYSANVMSELSTTFAYQMFSDQNITRFLYGFPEDKDLSIITKRLESIQMSAPLHFTNSIYVYNSSARKYYISSSAQITYPVHEADDFYDKEMTKILQNYKSYKHSFPIPRKIALPVYTSGEPVLYNVYTFVFTELPVNSDVINNAVVLNISQEWMLNAIKNLDKNVARNTFIVDSKGRIVASSNHDTFLKDLSDISYITKILDSSEKQSYFIDYVNHTKSLLIYTKYDKLNWTYIRTIPYDDIMSRITDMKRNTVIICSIILFACLIASYLMSRRLYKPINKVFVKLRQLEAEIRDNSATLKHQYLTNLLLGKFSDSMEGIEKEFHKLEIGLNPRDQFLIMLMVIDNYTSFCQKYNYSDRNLFKFALMNIASELSSSLFLNTCVDTGEQYITVLLNINTQNSRDVGPVVERLAKSIQQSISQYLGISVTVSVSSIAHNINNLKDLYNEVLNSSKYRLFRGHGSILLSDTISEADKYIYPANKEKLLTEALMLGKLEDVRVLYEDIVQSAAANSYLAFNTAITHLAYAINTAVDSIESNGYIDLEFNLVTFISEVSNMEILEDIDKHFTSTIAYIISRLNENKSPKYDELESKVNDIILQKYMDPNLSLDIIADQVQMSAAYLGRLYKKLTARSIPDCINEVRMEKAKEMLLSSSFTIDEIVQRIGFTNSSYFYRVFKKLHGVTPAGFKDKHN